MIFLKIILAIFTVQCFEVSCNPLFQGLSFKRGFEINFKPLEKLPIAFFTEKWSPFGVFGKKFAISKRSIDDMIPGPPRYVRVPRPAAPVFEHIDEVEQIGTGPLLILPKPVPKPPVLVPAPVPIVSKPPPAPVPLVSPPPPPPPPPPAPVPILKPPPPLPQPMPIIVNGLPSRHEKPVLPPIATNMVIIHPNVVNSHVTARALYTDITRVESVKEHVHFVKPIPPHHEEPKPPVPQSPVVPVPPPVVPPPPPPAPVPPPPLVPPPPPPAPVPPPPEPPKAPIPVPPPVPIKEEHPVPVKDEHHGPEKEAHHEAEKEAHHEAEKEEHHKGEKEGHHEAEQKEHHEDANKEHHIDHKKEHSEPSEGKHEFILKDSPWVKGSKMALQFGTVFLGLMAQFFDNARTSIDLMTNPRPVFAE